MKWTVETLNKAAYEAAEPEYELAKKLVSERLKAHLTQKEVAEKMHTTQSAIARLESATRIHTLKTITRYAEALGKRIEIKFKKAAN